MKIKPLIILLPVLVIFCALFLVEGRINETNSQKANANISNEYSRTINLKLVIGKVEDPNGITGVTIHSQCDDNAQSLGELQYNCCVMADSKEASDGWLTVQVPRSPGDDTIGYVRDDNVETDTLNIKCTSKKQYGVIRDAISYIGLDFIKYGKSLESGVDCSNFINQIFAGNDMKIPTTPNNIRDAAKPIETRDGKAGDIVYYNVNDGDGHVGIYLGSGYQINSSGHSGRNYPEGGVRITRIKYWDREEPEIYRLAVMD